MVPSLLKNKNNNDDDINFIECLSVHTVVSTFHILSHLIPAHTSMKKTVFIDTEAESPEANSVEPGICIQVSCL